jgi:hypothetical protein
MGPGYLKVRRDPESSSRVRQVGPFTVIHPTEKPARKLHILGHLSLLGTSNSRGAVIIVGWYQHCNKEGGIIPSGPRQ